MGWKKYLMGKCSGEGCPRQGQNWSLEMVGVNEDTGGRVVVCDLCGKRTELAPAAKVPKKKTTYPYYHEGCGVRFESESHEQKFAKAHKLEKV